MIERYTRPAMGALWSEENKYRQWLNVELAATEALAGQGEVPVEAARALRQHAGFSVERIQEIEQEVRHDVIAFTTAVAETMKAAGHAESSRWLHYGLTSNDIVDTAQALQLKESATLILAGLDKLIATLRRRAIEFKDAIAIGRTHGVHAEPITFGLKIALWYDDAVRARRRLAAAAEDLRFGKLSGAVGTLGHLRPESEALICAKLGLKAAPIASQVLSRDRHAAFVSALALVCIVCEKAALEVRHLQKTEVREAEEPFAAGQKGSSAMPHKRNPITCERIAGLSRVLRGNALAAMENVSLWHERDITHSSVERIIVPDSCMLLDYMLALTTDVLDRLIVYPDTMLKNLDRTHGLIFSQSVLLALTRKGMRREDAYRIVQGAAMEVWQSGRNFRDVLTGVQEVANALSDAELGELFNLEKSIRNVDYIFSRVGLA